jgi:transposase
VGVRARLERELRQRSVQDEATRRLLQVPGIGPITATALSATVVDPTCFKSAREFAAWIGLVPRQHSSGGHERLGRITKMGHAYLRRLLISGAQAVLLQAVRNPAATSPWLARLLREKPRKVVAVALANKTARIVWALLARGEAYRLAA